MKGEKIAIIQIKIFGLIIDIRKPSKKLNQFRITISFSSLGLFIKKFIEKYINKIIPPICNTTIMFGKT